MSEPDDPAAKIADMGARLTKMDERLGGLIEQFARIEGWVARVEGGSAEMEEARREPPAEVMEALTRLDAAIAKPGSNATHIDLATAQVEALGERLRRRRKQPDAEES